MSQKYVAQICPKCKTYHKCEVTNKTTEIICPNCQNQWGKFEKANTELEKCPSCGCRQFYLSKNFNQFVGCGVMLIGIVLVPFTFGLSLPVFAFIDWLLYRRYEMIANCYRCGMEFHHFSEQKKFKPFLHHIGLKYDKYR